MTADSTHQTAPASDEDLRACVDWARSRALDGCWGFAPLADRLEALASLLPALLDVADAAQEWVVHSTDIPPRPGPRTNTLLDAVRAYQEATDA